MEVSQVRPTESQKQRWLKYGANVVLSSILVIAVAVVLVWFVQKNSRRIDTTAAGLYSLKPQTLRVIAANPSPIKLVSLYRTKDDPDDPAAGDEREKAQVVRDVLLEYQRKGSKLEVEFIDPKSHPAKEDALIAEVEQKYGGEIKAYKSFLDEYEKQHKSIVDLCSAEVEQVTQIPPPKELDRETRQTFRDIVNTVDGFPSLLGTFKQKIDREREKKIPDYQLCASLVRGGVEGLNERLVAILQQLEQSKSKTGLPETIRAYLTDSLPRYQKIKEVCDAVLKTIDGLGDLKLDTLRRSLQQRDPILVMGENDIRILPFEEIWKDQADRRPGGGQVKARPRFAGEQMITTAIMAINNPKKTRVAFVRPGGPPLTDPGFPPFQPAGAMNEIAERLRQYNCEVVEKDLSGQWTMQAQMRGMPAGPEPTEEELADAIWVVLAFPSGGMGQPDPLSGPLKGHLDAGGSAMVVVAPRATGLDAALGDWGIVPRADLIAVHELIASPDGDNGDEINDARRRQYVFDLREYGDHAIVRPLASLESLMVPLLPVQTKPAGPVIATQILPLPADLKSWGETDFEALQSDQPVTFDGKDGDLAGPLFAGAAAEKQGAGRVVVIGSPTFAFNFEVQMVDPRLAREGKYVSRFPANAELFMNSVFWLAKMDAVIALSPAALEVSRIRPMSKAALNGWRIGLLLVGIPGAVIASGLVMYFKRRD